MEYWGRYILDQRNYKVLSRRLVDDSKAELLSYVDFELMSHLICRNRDLV